MDWLQHRAFRVVLLSSLCSLAAAGVCFSADVGQVSFFLSTGCPSGWAAGDGTRQELQYYDDGRRMGDQSYLNFFELNGGTTSWPSGLKTRMSGYWSILFPDFRGVFFRSGPNDTGGYDFERSLGSIQLDAFQGHYHNFRVYDGLANGQGYYYATGTNQGASTTDSRNNKTLAINVLSPITDGVNGSPRIAAESRPVNISLVACVRLTNSPVQSSGGGGSMVSTFTLVSVSSTAVADLTPGIWKNFTGGDISFGFGLLIAAFAILGFKAGGLR